MHSVASLTFKHSLLVELNHGEKLSKKTQFTNSKTQVNSARKQSYISVPKKKYHIRNQYVKKKFKKKPDTSAITKCYQ